MLGGEAVPMCAILETADGIILESLSDGVGRVEFSNTDADHLARHSVLCHNDLEPRNILVRETVAPGSTHSPRYELAGIVN